MNKSFCKKMYNKTSTLSIIYSNWDLMIKYILNKVSIKWLGTYKI